LEAATLWPTAPVQIPEIPRRFRTDAS